MYEVNEDAIGINSLCVRGGGWCLFLGNLYRIEQRGAYGEIKGLRESDDDDERGRGRGWMMDSLAQAQYP